MLNINELSEDVQRTLEKSGVDKRFLSNYGQEAKTKRVMMTDEEKKSLEIMRLVKAKYDDEIRRMFDAVKIMDEEVNLKRTKLEDDIREMEI